jgi:hypothetical protein
VQILTEISNTILYKTLKTMRVHTCFTSARAFPSASPAVKPLSASSVTSPSSSSPFPLSHSSILSSANSESMLSRSRSPFFLAYCNAALTFLRIVVGEAGATASTKCLQAMWTECSIHLILDQCLRFIGKKERLIVYHDLSLSRLDLHYKIPSQAHVSLCH